MSKGFWEVRPNRFLFWTLGWYLGWQNVTGFGPVQEFKTQEEAEKEADELNRSIFRASRSAQSPAQ